MGGSTVLSTSDPNVVAIIVDSGPTGSSYVNGPFVTVTLCDPGTSNCQDIDHVLIDTGSIGLRVLASKVKQKLPVATNTNGKQLAECLPFLSGTAWGEVRMADIKIGGETAPKMRVHLIGDETYPLPRNCSGTPINDSESLSSNGILGIGLNVQDCGAACNRKTGNPGVYYECSSTNAGGCAVAAVAEGNQLVNPITAFSEDNNGSFLQFPSIPAGGVSSQAGYLVFGIGTRPNNQLGNAKVIPVDDYGELQTTYNGKQYTSFIDSGSNGIFFLSSSASKIPSCNSGMFTGFYCPQNTMDLTASLAGKSGSVSFSFTVANASKFSSKNTAFAELGGPMFDATSDPSMPAFDWGFSFHFGRTIFCAIEGKSTPAGNGPYFAF
jgi:hypothetical protein